MRSPLTRRAPLQVILNGKVYDVTAFMPDHPGGKKAIMLYAGKDASEEFNMLHGACASRAYAARAALTRPSAAAANVLTKYLPASACLGAAGSSSKM